MSDRLDSLIDEVAAAMTAGDATPEFEANVARQIAIGNPKPQSAIRVPQYSGAAAAALATAAAVIVGILIMRPHEDHGKGRLKPAATVATTPATTAQQTPDAGRLKPATTRVVATGAVTTGAVATRAAATRGSAIRAAAAPAPGALPPLVNSRIDVAPLTVDSLTSPPISLDRLDTIERIDVAPLTLDDSQRRDR